MARLAGGVAALLLWSACGAPAPAPEPPDASAKPRVDPSPPDTLRGLVRGLGEHSAAGPLLAVELAVAEAQATLLDPLAAALRDRDAEVAARLLATCIEQPAWHTAERTDISTVDGITHTRWADTTTRSSELAAYLGAFTAVDHADLFVVGARPAGDGLALAVRFDLRGRTSAGRRHDRGTLTVFAGPVGDAWMSSRVRVTELETLSTDRGPHLSEAGRVSWPAEGPRAHGDLGTGPPLAMVDLDGDGSPEAVTTSADGAVVLSLATSPPSALDAPALAGLGPITALAATTTAAGIPRLVLCGPTLAPRSRCVVADDPLTAAAVTPVPGEGAPGVPGMAVAADLTGDGHADLWVGYRPDRGWVTRAPAPDPPATQAFWAGDDAGAFVPRSDAFRASAADTRAPPVATHAIATVIGDSGRTVLLVADGSGRGSRAYGWREDRFDELTGPMGLDVRGWTTGIAAGDADGDGLIDLFVSRLELVATRRMAWTWRDQEALPATRRVLRDLSRRYRRSLLLHHLPGDTFTDVGQRAGVDWAGAAAGVPTWLDHDADGDLDLYVPNGLWTGGQGEVDALFALSLATGDTHVDAPPPPEPALLAGFRGTLDKPFVDLGVPTLSLAGHQRAMLFRNDGGQFTEVAYLEGVDLPVDAWASATSDVNGDGHDDLVVRTRAPALPSDSALGLVVWHGGP